MRNNLQIREEMFGIIEQWEQSSLSQRAFCEQRSLKFHTFYYWYKCHKQQGNTDNNQSTFLELQIAKPATVSSVEIHFPGGIRVVFHEQVSSSYLKSMIS